MTLSFSRSPAFPPLSDAAEAIASLPWKRIGAAILSAILFSVAFLHVVIVRLWRNRGRLAPILRRIAAALSALADRLPEPLSAASPRPVLLSALMDAGHDAASLTKASRAALVNRARRAGLFQ